VTVTSADLVLEWCTLKGTGSRETFERAVGELLPVEANTLLSGLEVAGHLEVDWEHTDRWSVNPPVLALPAGGGGNAYLVGGRNVAMIDVLRDLQANGPVASLTQLQHSTAHASSWFVGARTMDDLQLVAAEIAATVVVDPAMLLMKRFPDLDQILSARRTEYSPSGFRAKQLNVQRMRYEPVDVKYAQWPPGCFEQLANGRRKYIFVDDDDNRYVCDRWVATHAEIRRQRRLGRLVPQVLGWDKETERMAVLSSAQLPTHWARAAAFCSGLPPRRAKSTPWVDIYEGVRLLTYGRFCTALAIQLMNTDLSNYDRERL
jgi:hypothetical protein